VSGECRAGAMTLDQRHVRVGMRLISDHRRVAQYFGKHQVAIEDAALAVSSANRCVSGGRCDRIAGLCPASSNAGSLPALGAHWRVADEGSRHIRRREGQTAFVAGA
jgi:hypothetical protein